MSEQIAADLGQKISKRLVRGRYNIVVGGAKADPSTVVREGVPLDEFKGGVESVRLTKDGNVCVTVRTVNRITAGERMSVTEEQLEAAANDPRLYKGLPGEFKFRSYRIEGIRELEVWTGRRWEPVELPKVVTFDELAAKLKSSNTTIANRAANQITEVLGDLNDRLEAAQAAASGGRPEDGSNRFDTWGEGGF